MPTKDHPCIVEGCVQEGRNQLGLRCRVAHDGASPFPNKKRTDAIYSIESEAYLCDTHALQGGTFLIMFEPDASKEVTIDVLSERTIEARKKHIKQPDEVATP
jgi:hypothetical protein